LRERRAENSDDHTTHRQRRDHREPMAAVACDPIDRSMRVADHDKRQHAVDAKRRSHSIVQDRGPALSRGESRRPKSAISLVFAAVPRIALTRVPAVHTI
jgi:hypothetical protein